MLNDPGTASPANQATHPLEGKSMFLLDRQAFRGADLSRLSTFVAFWERYYKDNVSVRGLNKDKIDYFTELNVSGKLAPENVTRLLRWKDPARLTHPRSDNTANRKVAAILRQLDKLNEFRRGETNATTFAEIANQVFSGGIVFKLFLFHIARPWDWPIADQHVFRAHAALFQAKVPRTIDEFQEYRTRFVDLAKRLGAQSGVDTNNRVAVTRSNKRLDNALMAYGQFLLKYDR
jgi:hypothetical protein